MQRILEKEDYMATDTPELNAEDMTEFLRDFIDTVVKKEGKTEVSSSIEELYPVYLLWKKEKDKRRKH